MLENEETFLVVITAFVVLFTGKKEASTVTGVAVGNSARVIIRGFSFGRNVL